MKREEPQGANICSKMAPTDIDTHASKCRNVGTSIVCIDIAVAAPGHGGGQKCALACLFLLEWNNIHLLRWQVLFQTKLFVPFQLLALDSYIGARLSLCGFLFGVL